MHTPPAALLHVALHVRDLERSIEFYTALLGAPPVKVRADYAKFEHAGLLLALELAPAAAPGGTLSHLGFRLDSHEAVAAERARLVRAGVAITRDEERTTCCYAVQHKFWVSDPDGNEWEIYRFLEDSDVKEGVGSIAAEPPQGPGAEVCCPGAGASERRARDERRR